MLWLLVMMFILFLTSVVDLMIRLLQAGGFFVLVFSSKVTTLEFAFIVVVVFVAVCMLIESVWPRRRRIENLNLM